VIIWRAENDAAESALRDERVSPLRRIGWRALGFVERVEVLSQHMVDGILIRKPERVVEVTDPERLRNLVVRLLRHPERDVIPVRPFQNQMSDIKDRIRSTGQLDLPGE